MQTPTSLPRWDASVLWPSLSSPEFKRDFDRAIEELEAFATEFTALEAQPADAMSVDAVLRRFNDIMKTTSVLEAFIFTFTSTDTRDDLAQATMSEFQQRTLTRSLLNPRITAWLGNAADLDFSDAPFARDHGHVLRLAAVEARHLMSPAEESLAAELTLSGGSAWSKLHHTLTSQIDVVVERDGTSETLPMSAVRNLAFDDDRAERKLAYDAELRAWAANAVPLAAAINGIKGESNAVTRRRHWESPLDRALFLNRVDRETLDAMLHAARDSFPMLRSYFRAKAGTLGDQELAWCDLFAPLGRFDQEWSFEASVHFVTEHFTAFSSRMGSLVERAIAESWIDAEPRPGKVDGAFCLPLREDESRVLLNFSPSYNAVTTLAHEMGHAYHNLALGDRTALQQETPSTLAETASTFCETIIRSAALAGSGPVQELAILDGWLQGAAQVVVDISSRFLFEQSLFAARESHELSVGELNQLMLAAQGETYGDAIASETLHPYMWAVKSHYYSVDGAFYNFPYMFGLLFGLGLYAKYEAEPAGFVERYDDLLSSTGMADAVTLAARFGIDLRSPEFWRSSLALIERDVERFVELTSQA